MRTRLFTALLLSSTLALACRTTSSSSTPTPTVSGVVVAGNGAFTARNATSQLTASASMSGGGTQDVSATATWSTSAPSVATVTSTGLVTAVGHGTATISASYQGSSGSLAALVTLRATPTFTPTFKRLCGPFRAGIDITIAETGGSIGYDISSLTIRFRDLSGNVRVTKTYNAAELSAALGGSNHVNAGQSKILTFEQSYSPVVETEDSTASVEATITDDVGNSHPINLPSISQRDRC